MDRSVLKSGSYLSQGHIRDFYDKCQHCLLDTQDGQCLIASFRLSENERGRRPRSCRKKSESGRTSQ